MKLNNNYERDIFNQGRQNALKEVLELMNKHTIWMCDDCGYLLNFVGNPRMVGKQCPDCNFHDFTAIIKKDELKKQIEELK